MKPRDAARSLAIGRMAVGVGLMVAPRLALAPFLGREAAGPAVSVLGRMAGVRDAVIGMIALHTLDHPEVGPRWQRTGAAVDAVDTAAILLARDAFPAAGVAAFVAVAAGATATGAWTSQALGSSG